MSSPEIALEMCPFCGSEAAYRHQQGMHWVRCTSCQTQGPLTTTKGSMAAAIAAWNRRAPTDEYRRGIEDAAKDESGWLIERADSNPAEPKYWAAGQRDAERSSAWTSNHMEGIRFARRDDAEKTARRMFKDIPVRVCEHIWNAPAIRAKGGGDGAP